MQPFVPAPAEAGLDAAGRTELAARTAWFECPETTVLQPGRAAEYRAAEYWAAPTAAPTSAGPDPVTERMPLLTRAAAEPITAAPVNTAVPVNTAAVWTEPVPAAPAAPPTRHNAPRSLRQPLAKGAVLATLVTLVGGGASALAMDKKITVTVDGQDRVLHTYADDVSGALAAAGLTPAPQDRIEPALAADLTSGDHVVVNRARKLTLVEGGIERDVWTTSFSVKDALHGLGVQAAPIQMSASPDAPIPLSGMSLELRVPRTVTVTDGTGGAQTITTTASTVAGLLAERGIDLGPDDVSVPAGAAVLRDGGAVQIVRQSVGEVVESKPIKAPEQVIEDPELPRGHKVVVEKGKPGQQMRIMRVETQNGREVSREQIRAGGSTLPIPRVVKLGTNDDKTGSDDEDATGYGSTGTDDGGSTAPKVSGGATWDKLAKCEATGNWSINSGNGYYGGLQFDAGTWKAYGGTKFASLPHKASREEQIAVATKVRNDRGGYGAWPGCSSKLGLG